MVVVGENLRSLMKQHSIVDDNSAFDQTSLSLRLGRAVLRIEPDSDSPESQELLFAVRRNMTRTKRNNSGTIQMVSDCLEIQDVELLCQFDNWHVNGLRFSTLE